VSKKILKTTLVFSLSLLLWFSSIILVFATTENKLTSKDKEVDLTFADIETLFANNILMDEDGKIKLRIEQDPELEKMLAECKKKGLKFGLALGSGSARGLSEIGVIQVLQAYNIPIDLIAGSSIGAVVGSLYAAGASTDQLEEAALSMKKRSTLFLIDPTLPRSGLINGKKIEEMLNELALEDKTFKDLEIPFAAVATDIESGAEVILTQGKVIDAVRASISIPGIFTPLKYQDYYLVDGGVVDPVPVDVTQKMGADIILAVSLATLNPRSPVLITNQETGNLEEVEKNSTFKPKAKSTGEGPNIFDLISQTLDIMEAKITVESLEGADVVIVPLGIKGIGLSDFDQAESLIKGGIMATLIKMPEIKEAIKEKLKQ